MHQVGTCFVIADVNFEMALRGICTVYTNKPLDNLDVATRL